MNEVIITNLITMAAGLFGGVSIITLIDRIRYRKQNGKLKDIEVKNNVADLGSNEAQTQLDYLNLVSDFYNKVKQVTDDVEAERNKQWQNQQVTLDLVVEKLASISNRLDGLDKRIGDIEGCLNGTLKDYKNTKK